MDTRFGWLLRALGVACAAAAVCTPPRPASACRCGVGPTELPLALRLESVTRDGAPEGDLAPWSGWEVQLVPQASGRLLLGARNRDNGRLYGEEYERAR